MWLFLLVSISPVVSLHFLAHTCCQICDAARIPIFLAQTIATHCCWNFNKRMDNQGAQCFWDDFFNPKPVLLQHGSPWISSTFPSPPLKSDMCSTFPIKSPCSSIFPKFPPTVCPMFSQLFRGNALISLPGPGHAALQAAPPGGRRGAAGGVGTEGAAASGDLHQPGHGDWARLKKNRVLKKVVYHGLSMLIQYEWFIHVDPIWVVYPCWSNMSGLSMLIQYEWFIHVDPIWVVYPCWSNMSGLSMLIQYEWFIHVDPIWVVYPCLSNMSGLSMFIQYEWFIHVDPIWVVYQCLLYLVDIGCNGTKGF